MFEQRILSKFTTSMRLQNLGSTPDAVAHHRVLGKDT